MHPIYLFYMSMHPAGCVAEDRNIQIFIRFRALPDGRLNA
jgi:hypothetical protein